MKHTESTPPRKGANLKAGLRYAGLGWKVLPVHGIVRGQCTCGKRACDAPGKHPRLRNGVRGASGDEKRIRGWLSKWPDANLAVATGQASGIIVLDIDGPEGRESLQKLAGDLGELPPAPTAKTGRGHHLFFCWPGRKVRSRIGAAPGIDLKADAGYVVVPPSHHANGSSYTWEIPPEGIPPPELPNSWSLWAVSQNSAEGPRNPRTTQKDPEAPRSAQESSPRSSPSEDVLDFPRAVLEAIEATQPRRPGERWHRIFEFVRRLKAIPEIRDADPRTLKPAAKGWLSKAIDIVGTKDFETTWADFQFAWEEVRHPWGESPLSAALERAETAEPPPRAVALYGARSARTRLASVCRELQRGAGETVFFLSSHIAAEFLEVSPRQAARWLKRLESDQVLQRVSIGSFADHRASEYRYIAD